MTIQDRRTKEEKEPKGEHSKLKTSVLTLSSAHKRAGEPSRAAALAGRLAACGAPLPRRAPTGGR